MFERALVIEYLSQSRNKTISGIRMKNSIFESHFGKMLLTWVTLFLIFFFQVKHQKFLKPNGRLCLEVAYEPLFQT